MKKLVPFLLNNLPRPFLIRISWAVMKATSLLYRGHNFSCPICGGRLRRFLPYGYKLVREGALCPSCFSLERHRLLWLFLQRRTNFFSSPQKVLHVAPEQSFYRRFRQMKNLEYITSDLESPLADIRADLLQLPFEDGSFDVVICNHVLEHVKDDRKAMGEILRVLKPGGYAILQVPADYTLSKTLEDPLVTDPDERQRLFRQKDHLRLYGQDYPDRLKNAGFLIRDGNFFDELTQEEKQNYGLPDHEWLSPLFKPADKKIQ